MQAVEGGEMSSLELADSVAKTGCSHNLVNLSPIVPPSVTGSFTLEPALRRLPASARGAKPVAWFRQAVHRLLLFVIPHPLGFEIGPQTIRRLSSPVFCGL